MIKSIQRFQTKGIEELQEVFTDYVSNMTKIAEMVHGVTKSVATLGLEIIAEELEFYDEQIRESEKRKARWHVVRKDETSLITSLGTIRYRKTLYKDKETGKREYLLDKYMDLKAHTRITEDAMARILEEAAESSYLKGGMNVAIGDDVVSKETVMNKLHALKFPEKEPLKEKRAVKYLYIDGDEDHVSLQYINQKGDIGSRRRINGIMPKIIYVYEGIKAEGVRRELINPAYFGGVYDGEDVKELWDEAWRYIEASYDIEALEKIYISGDGAAWIKAGAGRISQGKFVLDKFHMHKYIISATSHLKDDAASARSDIYRAIHRKRKQEAADAFDRIVYITKSETKRRTVIMAKEYILNNWSGIMEHMKARDAGIECSAEGHVSHVYSDRMSSRPLGWCRDGVDKMARLRIYRQNGGDMLELVRYQKAEIKKAAGAEEMVFSAADLLAMEAKNRRRLGSIADTPIYSIPYPQIKKIAALRHHIWGL